MNETVMAMIEDSGYNVVMPYSSDNGAGRNLTRAGLDVAHKHNVRVIVDIAMGVAAEGVPTARARVDEFRSHPATLGWYTSDERGLNYLPALADMHAYVAKTDPDHPTWSVFTAGQVGAILDFDEAFDAVGTQRLGLIITQLPPFNFNQLASCSSRFRCRTSYMAPGNRVTHYALVL